MWHAVRKIGYLELGRGLRCSGSTEARRGPPSPKVVAGQQELVRDHHGDVGAHPARQPLIETVHNSPAAIWSALAFAPRCNTGGRQKPVTPGPHGEQGAGATKLRCACLQMSGRAAPQAGGAPPAARAACGGSCSSGSQRVGAEVMAAGFACSAAAALPCLFSTLAAASLGAAAD